MTPETTMTFTKRQLGTIITALSSGIAWEEGLMDAHRHMKDDPDQMYAKSKRRVENFRKLSDEILARTT